MARTGKIARLPLPVREELCRRMQNGELGPQLLPWLNALPEVLTVLDTHFHEQPINAQNLSDWRNGGFQDWLRQRDRIAITKIQAEKCVEIARAANGNLSEGMAAIAAGELLTLKEEMDEETDPIKKLLAIDAFTRIIERIRQGDHNRKILGQNDRRLDQNDEKIELVRQKLQRDQAAVALRVLGDERAKQIESTPGLGNEDKIELMGKHLFGDLWQPRPQTPPAK